jgi:putative ABC transport system permease protein
MIEDIRYALRQLRKNPGFAAATVLTLALGVGAAAAMFGLIQGVLLSPPPYANPERLVLLSPARIDGQPYTRGVSIGQWIDWRSVQSIEAPALYRWTFNFLVLPDGSESLGGMVVTQNFFNVVGLTPVLGREFVASEASRPKGPPTGIILGYELWQRKFNGDPNIVGSTVRLSRYPAPFPVVGVMPAGVRFLPDPANASEPNYDVNAHVDFWLSTAPDETQPRGRGWNAVSRLKAGTTARQAQTELAALAVNQARANPDLDGLTTAVRPALEVLNTEGRALLMPLFGSVALVFLVACVNVAGLFVARGLRRHREYAMRAALGASRRRLFRQLLTESVTLSMISAVVGAALAAGTVTLFKSIGGHAVPRADAVTVGWPVFAFGCFAAPVAAILAGVLPALRASSPHHFGTQGRANERGPGRAPDARRNRDRADRPDGGAACRRGVARPHRKEPGEHSPGLRHPEHPGDDGDDRDSQQLPAVSHRRPGASGGSSRCRSRGVCLGSAADGQQMARNDGARRRSQFRETG